MPHLYTTGVFQGHGAALGAVSLPELWPGLAPGGQGVGQGGGQGQGRGGGGGQPQDVHYLAKGKVVGRDRRGGREGEW